AQTGVGMGINVTGAKIFREKVIERAFRAVGAVIDHHRNVSNVAGAYSLDVGSPFRPGEVSALDADNGAGIAEGHIAGGDHLHVSEIVFKARTAHAGADDVDEGEDAGVL